MPSAGSLWLTGSGDGFFALYGSTLIQLDAGGRALARKPVTATSVTAVVRLGADVCVAVSTSAVDRARRGDAVARLRRQRDVEGAVDDSRQRER